MRGGKNWMPQCFDCAYLMDVCHGALDHVRFMSCACNVNS